MSDAKKNNPLIGSFRTSEPPPDKPKEEKAPTEPPKGTGTPPAPVKPDEGKKPSEPPEADEEKKPTEGEKKAPDSKAPTAPGKPAEEKKTAEPPKAGEEKKPAEGEKATDGKGEELTRGQKAALTTQKNKEERERRLKESEEKESTETGEIPADLKLEILSTSKMGTETMVPIELIDDFEGHPFAVKDDKDMEDLVASVKQAGILEPVTIIRNPKKPGRFEMVSGHRRKHAAKLAGLTHVRAFVREMDHDEAIIAMVDSNLKRDKISPMEKARAYQMKSEALRRKAGRRTKEEAAALKAAGIKPKTADELLAEQTGESVATVQRTKTLTKLTEPMQKLVESGDLPVNAAADIAQLKPEEQNKLADAIEKEGGTVPSGTKAKELKEESRAGTLTPEKIEASVAPTKREEIGRAHV